MGITVVLLMLSLMESLGCAHNKPAQIQGIGLEPSHSKQISVRLVEAGREDQAVRAALLEAGQLEPTSELRELNRRNARVLSDAIEDLGGRWPDAELVGQDASTFAWLIAVHSDHDPEFQRSCLHLFEDAVDRGVAETAQLALLTDRVLINEGKPQRYGTQASIVDCRVVSKPIEDPAGLAARRVAIGLPPLDEYYQQLQAHYGQGCGSE